MASLLTAAPGWALPWAATADAGYAFRSASDGRNHGATAAASLDIPLPGPLALRPEVLALGFGASKDAPRGLGLFGADLALVYSFDDTDVQALAAVGPFAGAAVDADVVAAAGVVASLGLRFPVADGFRIEAKVALPELLWTSGFGAQAPGQTTYADGVTPVAFPLQATFSFGLVVDFGALFSSELR